MYEAPYISRFYKKIPLDNQRIKMAEAAYELALQWVLLHEEAHYRNGHLHYIQNVMSTSSNEPVMASIQEAYSTEFSQRHPRKAYLMEWQADRLATEHLLELNLASNLFDGLWPTSETKEKEFNLRLRFLILSIGIAISILEIAHIKVGLSKHYPRPSERMNSVFFFLSWYLRSHEAYFPNLYKFPTPTSDMFEYIENLFSFSAPLSGGVNDISNILYHVGNDLDLNDQIDFSIGEKNMAVANLKGVLLFSNTQKVLAKNKDVFSIINKAVMNSELFENLSDYDLRKFHTDTEEKYELLRKDYKDNLIFWDELAHFRTFCTPSIIKAN